jgi:hypothetical protein
MTRDCKPTIRRDHHATLKGLSAVPLIFDGHVMAGDIRNQPKPSYGITVGLIHNSPIIVGFRALHGSPTLRPGPSVK